jgi:hypothetical protein
VGQVRQQKSSAFTNYYLSLSTFDISFTAKRKLGEMDAQLKRSNCKRSVAREFSDDRAS